MIAHQSAAAIGSADITVGLCHSAETNDRGVFNARYFWNPSVPSTITVISHGIYR